MPLSTYMTFALPWFVCVPAFGLGPLASATLGIIRAASTNGTTFFITGLSVSLLFVASPTRIVIRRCFGVKRAGRKLHVKRRAERCRLCRSRLERELAEVCEAGNANAHEPQRAGSVAEPSVELPAGKVADGLGRVDPGVKRGRAAADREVG